MPAVTLFDKIEENREEAVSGRNLERQQKLMRLERVRENLELSKRQFIDNPDWQGELEDEELVVKARNRWEKVHDWLAEHYRLILDLVQLGVDRTEWHCRRCGSLITAGLVGNDSCHHCTDEKVKHLYDVFERRGWLAIKCPTLSGEVILIVRDMSVEPPEKYQQCVRYTPSEVRKVAGSTDSMVKMVHQTKRATGGEVTTERSNL